MSTLTPFVFWAQNSKRLFLKVDLKDVKDPDIKFEKYTLQFQSKGVGAKGLHQYAFTLEFHEEIDPKESICKITANRVEFVVAKVKHDWWPRLIQQGQKPVWLKIDHDKFQTEDMDEKGDFHDVKKDYPHLYEKLQKDEIGYKREDFKKVYLCVYNLVMYVGFVYVISALMIRYIRDGSDSYVTAYAAVGPAMCFLHMLQCLEILHPLFGYVKGGVLMPFLQVGGRVMILLGILDLEPKLQKMPVVFYLFVTWSLIEVIRYPYYLSQLCKKEIGLLTWMRYTFWIVCYPVGFLCEGVIIFRMIIFLEQGDKWSVYVPQLDATLRVSHLLRFHLLFLVIPSMYTLMSHMYKARQRKLGPISKKIGGKKKIK